jgi:predicted DNA-binding transcriptional regulator AlpA
MTRRSNPEAPAIDRLISAREARAILGIGRTSEATYRATIAGFPPRVQVGPGRYAYRASELAAWIASRPAVPTAPAPQHALAGRARQRAETSDA